MPICCHVDSSMQSGTSCEAVCFPMYIPLHSGLGMSWL